jgi:hypothetical protein
MMSNAIARSKHRVRLSVATYVGAIFLWTLALSVSPQLHEQVHSDAKSVQHECAITLIAAGNYHYAAAAPLLDSPVPATQFSKIPALNSIWIQSLFLSASIFEHAPPVVS